MNASTDPADTSPIDDRRSQADALASSTPDDKSILMQMLQMLIGAGTRHPALQVISNVVAGIIMMVFVIAAFGVPALLAFQGVFLQWDKNKTEQVIADREVQRQQVTATREVLDAIGSIGSKLDTQSAKIDDQGRKLDDQGRRLDALAGDVADLQRGQAANSRGLANVEARQRLLEQPGTGISAGPPSRVR